MGGVVEDVVSGVGDIGQGAIDTVSDAASGFGGAIENLAESDIGKAALLAAGAYYAAPYVMGTGAATGTGITAGSSGLGLTGAGTTAAGGLGAGIGTSLGVGAGEAALGAGLAGSTVGGLGLGAGTAALGGIGAGLGTSAAVGGLGAAAAGSGLVGGALDWAKANPLSAAALGLGAAKALGGSSTTGSSSSIDPDVKAAYLQNLADARATAAGLAPKQFAAFPEYNLGMVQQYMNPYEQQVIQGTLGDIERVRQGQISQEGAQATAAKAFGGTRQAVTRSLVDEAALRNATNAVAQLRQTGFTQAQNLGLSQEALRQQYEQSKLDAQRNLGLERLGISQGALSLQPSGGTQSAPLYKNTTASALGGALGGAQLGSLFGGTSGAQAGALAGGLLGFL